MVNLKFMHYSFARTISLSALLAIFFTGKLFADYSEHPLASEFINKMVNEHKFQKAEIITLLQQAEKKQTILDAISRPAERTKKWDEYQDIFLGDKRVTQGVEFWQKHQEVIAKVAEEYQVAPEIIVAIIGVETRYGRYKGKFRVVDALSTLGFDYPKRAKFFRKQLEHFILLAREQKLDPLSLKGSYAGAMGYGQFIPSSYRDFAVDFTNDNVADIWNNPDDAIASVANYFKKHGWRNNEPVLTRARFPKKYDTTSVNQKGKPAINLDDAKSQGFIPTQNGYDQSLLVKPLLYQGKHGKEFWLGFHNYYVITRYNHSRLYAMAVWQLSQKIKAKKSS